MPRPPGKITRPFQLFRDLASRTRRTQSDCAMRITLVYAERIRVFTLAGSTLLRPSTVRWCDSPVSLQRASLATAGLSLCFAESASTTKGRHRVPTQNVPRRLRRGMLLRLRNQFRRRRDLGPGSRRDRLPPPQRRLFLDPSGKQPAGTSRIPRRACPYGAHYGRCLPEREGWQRHVPTPPSSKRPKKGEVSRDSYRERPVQQRHMHVEARSIRDGNARHRGKNDGGVPDDHTEHEAHKDRVGRGVVDESSPCISVVECKGPTDERPHVPGKQAHAEVPGEPLRPHGSSSHVVHPEPERDRRQAAAPSRIVCIRQSNAPPLRSFVQVLPVHLTGPLGLNIRSPDRPRPPAPPTRQRSFCRGSSPSTTTFWASTRSLPYFRRRV